jgi:hypothetical protein
VFKLNYRSSKPAAKRARKMETLGLIVIVILILVLTITRSWHLIAWSAR